MGPGKGTIRTLHAVSRTEITPPLKHDYLELKVFFTENIPFYVFISQLNATHYMCTTFAHFGRVVEAEQLQ